MLQLGRCCRYMWPVLFGAGPVTEPVEPCDLLHCDYADIVPGWHSNILRHELPT